MQLEFSGTGKMRRDFSNPNIVKGAKILIVDDRAPNRVMITSYLEPEGYVTQSAKNGIEALEAVANFFPDLIVMDVKMPEMDGYQACALLKKDPLTREIPVIFVTCASNEIKKAFEAGGSDHLQKPIRKDELLVRINVHLRMKELVELQNRWHERLESKFLEKVKDLEVVRQELEEEKRAGEEKIDYISKHDHLTGLGNRQELLIQLNHRLQDIRDGSGGHCLMFLDLDQFKVINDTCGHVAGDELLRAVANLLKDRIRKDDLLVRLGGDEFAILLERSDLKQAEIIAEKLREAIYGMKFNWQKSRFQVRVSIGVIVVNDANESVEKLLGFADSACHAAKELGRNRIHLFYTEKSQSLYLHREMEWVSTLTRAIEEDRIILMRQVIEPTRTEDRKGAHYEILVRLREPEGNLTPPGAFLPAAEKFSMMPTLDRFIVNKTLHWLADHPGELENLSKCAINLSGQSLGDEHMYSFIVEKLNHYAIPAEKICFEVTETSAVINLSRTISFIEAVRKHGCLFALDDFGSGFSSYTYLKHLPADYLKIDGSFVLNIVDDPIDFAFVESMNHIGHVLGKKTIAEYVENDAIFTKLKFMGVDYVQGFGIGKPELLIDQ